MKTLIPIILIASMQQIALGQHWQQLPDFYGGRSAIYFLTPNYGFCYQTAFDYGDSARQPGPRRSIATNALVSSSEFMRTTDGASHWTSLPFFDSLHLFVAELFFVTQAHGYVATAGYSPGSHNSIAPFDFGGIFETFDSGQTWQRISPNTCPYTSVYAISNAVFASELPDTTHANWGTLIFSKDDGMTWDSVVQPSANRLAGLTCVIGNRDSLVATTMVDTSEAALLVWSSDLGTSWTKTPLPANMKSATAILAFPYTCKLLLQYWDLKNPEEDKYAFAKSDVDYQSWSPILNAETGKWMSGNTCALYVSNADVNLRRDGLYRSTSEGHQWVSGGGPDCGEIDDRDFRNLSVVGYGSVVFVNDGRDNFWESTDGGDGALSIDALAPRLSFTYQLDGSSQGDTLYSLCNGGIITVIDQNLRCALTHLQGISIDGLDSSEYSVIRTHHTRCASLPDTTHIDIIPKFDTTRRITVHAHFMDDEYSTIDTSFAIILVSQHDDGKASSSLVTLGAHILTASSGDTISIPVILVVNRSSDTMTIGSLNRFQIALNTDLLTPLEFQSSVVGATGSIVNVSKYSATLSLAFSKVARLTGQSSLGVLRCIARAADTTVTKVLLTSYNLRSPDSGCISGISPEDNYVLVTIAGCGIATVSQFMKSNRLTDAIENISPNPATESINVFFRNDLKRPISYKIVDELGVARMHGLTEQNELHIDISHLPNGLYYLRAQTNSGIANSRKIIIAK